MIRARLESVIPAAYGRLVAFAGAYRERIAASIGNAVQRRRFWDRLFAGSIANGREPTYAYTPTNSGQSLTTPSDDAARKSDTLKKARHHRLGPMALS